MLNLKNNIIELNNIYTKVNLLKNITNDKEDVQLISNVNKKKINSSLYCRLIQKKNNTFVHINHTNNRFNTETLITPNLLSIKNLNKKIKGKKSNYFLQEKLLEHLIKFLSKNQNKNFLILNNTEKKFNNLLKSNIFKKDSNILFSKIKWNIRKNFN